MNGTMSLMSALLLASCARGGAPVPLEDDYIGFTSRTSLVASGDRIAWIEITRGDANVFGCTLPACVPRPLTNYEDADGMDIGAPTFGTNYLYYTRGQLSATNPISEVRPAELTTFAIKWPHGDDAKPSDPIALAPYAMVASTPVGDRALFAVGAGSEHLTLREVAAGSAHEGTPGLESLVTFAGVLGDDCHGNPAVVYAPNGETLAMTIRRLEHSFIAIWSRGDRNLRWLSPSRDDDGCPAWSPDGAALAFVRLVSARPTPVRYRARRDRDTAQGASEVGHHGVLMPLYHQAPSFSVLVARIAPASASASLHAEGQSPRNASRLAGRLLPWLARGREPIPVTEAYREAAESSYPGTGENGYGLRPLSWTADGVEVIFGSEATGYTHVRSAHALGDVPRGTNRSRDLTPWDACECQAWDAASSGFLFVAHTCATDLNFDALAVSRVTMGTTGRRLIVAPADANTASGLSGSGSGLIGLANGTAAFLSTAHNASARVAYWTESRSAPVLLVTGTAGDAGPRALARFVKPLLVTFPSNDGQAVIHAQLFQPPPSSLPQPSVAAIFTHGGSQRQMYAAMHYSPTYARLYALCQQLAIEAGIPVLSINYRSGVGYGRAFRLCGAPHHIPGERRCGSLGALEYDDVRAGRTFLDARLSRPAKVGIFGLSYGGLNCLQALSRDPQDYAAGACNAPVYNWISQMRFDGFTGFDPAPRLPPFLHQLPVGPTSTEATPDWPSRAAAAAKVAFESSPAAHTANITGPLLLIHGDLDQEVPFQESRSLAQRLRAQGSDVETLFFPDECHGECAYANQLTANGATAKFLIRQLLGK